MPRCHPNTCNRKHSAFPFLIQGTVITRKLGSELEPPPSRVCACPRVMSTPQPSRHVGPLPLCFVLDLEQSCNQCATSFKDNDTKHHCRACGEGFCDSCSSKTRPVPERGWGPAPVRVCDNCYDARNVQLGNVGLEAAGKHAGRAPFPMSTGYWALDA